MDRQEKQTIGFSSLLRLIRKSLGVIVSLAIIAFVGTYILINEYMPSKYTVRSSVAIIPRTDVGLSFNENRFVQAADKYYGLLDSEIFRQLVWENVEGDRQPADKLTIVSEEASNLIFLEGESTSPKRAFSIAKSAINNYKKMINYSQDSYFLDTFSLPNAEQIQEKSNRSFLLAAAVSGLVLTLGIFLVALSYIFSDKVYTIEQAKRKINGRFIGSIAAQKKDKKGKVVISQISTPAAIVKDYQKTAISIDYSMRQAQHNVLLISSVNPGEGKSTAALNLAIALHQLNRKVLLLDLDLRHPKLAEYAHVEVTESTEISQLLLEKKPQKIKQYIKQHEDLGIDYIFGKKAIFHEEPAVIERLEQFLKVLKREYDYIIIDTSPIGIVKETYLKASLAEEILLVVRQGTTNADQVNKVIEDMRLSNLSLIGFILNGVPLKD